ncbi:MAG: AmmeMemoRadiSam system protein A [Planctomycetes bacterium]|nr:AmmeMemoRadiSam system protein A [Planctomycetota bacterium]
MALSGTDRRLLLALARSSLEDAVRATERPLPASPSSDLAEKRGAFVTLYRASDLRGCIGRVQPLQPLWETVAEMTAASATRDPRFAAILASELPEISIQISVLSPLRRIRSLDEIEVGRHGLYVRKSGQTGVLLPQVAERCGWSAGRFYAETLRKGEIRSEPSRLDDDVEAFVYEAEVFQEQPDV